MSLARGEQLGQNRLVNENDQGILIGLAFWAVVIGIAVVRSYFADKRPPKRERATAELAQNCPRCNIPLRGLPLTDEEVATGRRGWQLCFQCGLAQPIIVGYPYSLDHRKEIERKNQITEEKVLIEQYEKEIQNLERQRRQRQKTHLDGLLELTPIDFEHAVASILAENGYQDVKVVGGAGDLNVDIECVSPTGKRTAVQCKRYSDTPVGSKEMQTFIGMIHRHHKIGSAMFVTTSRYTKPAQELATRHKIELIDGEELVRRAATLQGPKGLGNEAEEIESLRKKMHGLSAWPVVQKERNDAMNERLRQERMERIRNARRYGGRRRY